MSELVISAKDLGQFAKERPCQRCLWVGLHAKQLPYQSFPGIFSSIDSYNKRVVEKYFDREGTLPGWLSPLGEVKRYIPPPSYQRFSVNDPDTGVTLRGTADAIFQMRDHTYAIVDYKTARYTAAQDSLLPVYQVQLNGYAYIANRLELGPVSRLALVYMEPVTDGVTAASPEVVDASGFIMGLSATVVPVTVDPESMIPMLMRQARDLDDLAEPPEPSSGCKDCRAMKALISLLG